MATGNPLLNGIDAVETGSEDKATSTAEQAKGNGVRVMEVCPSAKGVFEKYFEWHNAQYPKRGVGAGKRFGARTKHLYGSFWGKYTDYLTEHCGAKRWDQANSDDVVGFFGKVEPRSKREKKQNKPLRQISHVTRQRYESVFHKIYCFALANKDNWTGCELDINPVVETQQEQTTKREQAQSFILHSGLRKALIKGIDLNAEGWDARDSALLALMIMQGLTPAELRSLQCANVQSVTGVSNWEFSPHVWDSNELPKVLDVPEISRKAQARALELDPISQKALHRWMQQRNGMMSKGGESILLFGKQGPITAVRIYQIAQEHILKVLVQGQTETGITNLHHAGPMALRNAVILKWMDEISDVSEVLRRSGLGQVKSLKRIVEFAGDEAQQRYLLALEVAQEEDAATQEE